MSLFQELKTKTPAQLDIVLDAGVAPALRLLVGSEFRGQNVFAGAPAKLVGVAMGIERFGKGFFSREAGDAAEAEGFNLKIKRASSSADPWTDIAPTPTRHGFFRVFAEGAGENRGGRHENAFFLDYSLGNPKPGLFDGGGLHDFVVQPDPTNTDVFLGKAYMKVGPVSIVAGFFIIERWRPSTFSLR
jgi:hypothetical protein